MKVAIVSLNSIWEDKEANLVSVERIVQLVSQKADYVIFPEMSLTGFSVSNLSLAEDFENSNSIKLDASINFNQYKVSLASFDEILIFATNSLLE